uniref:class I SAM-dependent methyltransferase n=1 Tax=Nocardia suismassiliense TaxID=2077092 RepID=UPI003F49697D
MMTLAEDQAARAVAPYTRPFLTIYDLWVIRLSNRYGWRCPAGVMLKMYRENLGARHLEIGPGSGWYLANTPVPATAAITLMDLNPAPLAYVRRRLEALGCEVRTVVGNVLEPVPAEAGSGFDSIGLNFVLHCVPGDFAAKGVAFTHLVRVLDDDGVLFGSTILDQRPSTLFGRALSAAYRRVGAFNNHGDTRPGLEAALAAAFRVYSITEVGDICLFTARQPRR